VDAKSKAPSSLTTIVVEDIQDPPTAGRGSQVRSYRSGQGGKTLDRDHANAVAR